MGKELFNHEKHEDIAEESKNHEWTRMDTNGHEWEKKDLTTKNTKHTKKIAGGE